MKLPASLAVVASVLRNPDMRRLQFGCAASSFALWSSAITLGVYAFGVGGAAAVGIAGLVRLLPGALASPFGGLIGDRYSRRSVLVASALGGAVALACSAAAVALGLPAAVVFVLAAAFTVVTCPYVPAEGALLPVVARSPQELSSANVAHSVMDNSGFLAGALLTGMLLAVTSTAVAFAAAAAACGWATLLLARLDRDERPAYAAERGTSGALHETALGARALLADAKLRLIGTVLVLLVLFEGAADVLVVILALDLLGLGDGSVGYLNAAWGVGAIVAGAGAAVLHGRGRLAAGLVLGSLIAGAAMALPGAWVVPVAAVAGWFWIGIGYTLVEVAARTLMQRLGSDETLARTLGFLETACFAAMAVGSILAPALVAMLGDSGALIAFGALLPGFALLRWAALRSIEIGAPVDEGRYTLLRAEPIFAPLPVDTLERITHALKPIAAAAGEEIVVQGERGEHFYLIESGSVEVFEDGLHRRTEGAGESFGEIALIRDVPRTATVRANEPTALLALSREQFLSAVTGHRRSAEAAGVVANRRLAGEVPVIEAGKR